MAVRINYAMHPRSKGSLMYSNSEDRSDNNSPGATVDYDVMLAAEVGIYI